MSCIVFIKKTKCKEVQLKIPRTYHLTPIRIILSTTITTTKTITIKKILGVGKEADKLDPLCNVGGNIKWCSHYGKNSMAVLQKSNTELPYDTEILLLGI